MVIFAFFSFLLNSISTKLPVLVVHATLGLDEGAAESAADVILCPSCGVPFEEMEHLVVALRYGVTTSIWHDGIYHQYRSDSSHQ